MWLFYNRSTFPSHFEDLTLPRVPNANDPDPQHGGEGINRLVWAMSDATRSGLPIASDVQVYILDRASSWQKGRVTGRIKIGSLNFKVYNEIFNKHKLSRNYISDRCDRWKNIGSTSQCRRTTNCLDGVTLLQWATRLRQRDRLALVTGSIKVNDC